MIHSTCHLLHMPDELLLMILSKISNLDVLYSLIDVSRKLDSLARDFVHTRSIKFIETTPDSEIQSLSANKLDRFCENILPRIHQNIECFTLESSSMCRIFHSTNYPNLFKLVLPEVDLELAPIHFDGNLYHYDVKRKFSCLLF